MKSKWISFFATAVICLTGLSASAAAQIGHGQSLQYPAYDSVAQPVYYEGSNSGVSYGAAVSYQSPIVENRQYQSPTHYPTSVQRPVAQTVVQTTSGNHYTSTNPQPGLAQQKATQAAQMSFRDHVGGGLGGAKFEGVGWSNLSPQTAIQNCCYWGQRPPAQIGVSKSSDGCWYACVLYH